jgi:formylglycine-generating enzyme required for sulfatase activity
MAMTLGIALWGGGLIVHYLQGGFEIRMLTVETDPPGAEVLLDDFQIGFSPLHLAQVEPGHHVIKLIKSRYQPITRTVLLQPGQPLEIEESLALSRWGELIISAEPAGATVYLDGKVAGTTPLTLNNLPAGTQAVRIEKEGYAPWNGMASIQPPDPTRLRPRLAMTPQRLQEIDTLLERAAAHARAGNLEWPEKENALELYRAVIALDPENGSAQRGLGDLLQVRLMLFEAALLKKDLRDAQFHLERAEKISPWSDQVKGAMERLRLARTNAPADQWAPTMGSEALAASGHDGKPTKGSHPEVERLLARARVDLEAGRLDDPPGENALARYQAALTLAPEDERIREGFAEVAFRHAQRAYQQEREKNPEGVRHAMAAALSTLMAYPRLLGTDNARKEHAKQVAKKNRVAMAAPNKERWIDPDLGISFAWVTGGCFLMGDARGDPDERPAFRSCVSDYWLGVHEVTQAQWQAVMGNAPSQYPMGTAYPVESISWTAVQLFLAKLNQGNPTRHYRLPSEAEWEYGCRGGKWGGRGTPTPEENNGDASSNDVQEHAPPTHHHAVGQTAANPLGLQEMRGNVAEWTATPYREEASPVKRTSEAEQAVMPTGRWSVRGGHWRSDADDTRCQARNYASPFHQSPLVGVRLARDPE